MASSSASISSLSARDKWIRMFESYDKNLKNVQGLYLNQLPFAILNDIANKISPLWEEYKPFTKIWVKEPTQNARTFILTISNKNSQFRLSDLLNFDKRTNNTAITNCLTVCRHTHQRERRTADQDKSQGFMRDLDDKTLIGLCQNLKTSWLLGDALGFSNLECRQFKSAYPMIKAWMEKFPKASLSRLHFEANRLNLKSTCDYLKAIPLECTQKPEVPCQSIFYFTKYQQERLNQICSRKGLKNNWNNIGERKDSYVGLKYLDENDMSSAIKEATRRNPNIASDSLLWKTLEPCADVFKEEKKLKPVIAQFKEEVKNGIFIHQSPGGITYDQIIFLSQLPSDLKNGLNVEILTRHVFPFLELKNKAVKFEGFLLLCWQDPTVGANLGLHDFSLLIMHYMKTAKTKLGNKACKSSKVRDAFKQNYLTLKPKRSYDPILDATNRAQLNKETAKAVHEIAKNMPSSTSSTSSATCSTTAIKETWDSVCGICMERPRKIALDPCGHFGYCLECIKSLADCPVCRTKIDKKITIYDISNNS